MTPIEQVRPSQPGNWVRRPEGRKKRGNEPRTKQPKDKQGPQPAPGDGSGREHIVDELA